MSDLKAIEAMALGMNEQEKAILAEKLLCSMEIEDKGDVEKEWKLEVERRVQKLESGKTTLIPGEQVFAEAEKRLKK